MPRLELPDKPARLDVPTPNLPSQPLAEAADAAHHVAERLGEAIDSARSAIGRDGGPSLPSPNLSTDAIGRSIPSMPSIPSNAIPTPSLRRPGQPDLDLGAIVDSVRRAIARVLDRTSEVLPDGGPDLSAVADRVPSRASLVAAIPAATAVARRIPSSDELAEGASRLRDAAADASADARSAALDLARRTPLGDRLPAKKGPGPIGIVFRILLGAALAGAVAFAITNRERVRAWLVEARTRAARAAAARRDAGWGGVSSGAPGGTGTGTWSASDEGQRLSIDDVETSAIGTSDVLSTGSASGSHVVSDVDAAGPAGEATTASGAAGDLDAVGWGTAGTPTAPRQLSADVTAMTTPSPSPQTGLPDELGE